MDVGTIQAAVAFLEPSTGMLDIFYTTAVLQRIRGLANMHTHSTLTPTNHNNHAACVSG